MSKISHIQIIRCFFFQISSNESNKLCIDVLSESKASRQEQINEEKMQDLLLKVFYSIIVHNTLII